ncbi:MAG: hypothetical protein J6M60_06095 [Clostridia bacterium]|nr:hypothetical protein [Clostridia bacterium]
MTDKLILIILVITTLLGTVIGFIINFPLFGLAPIHALLLLFWISKAIGEFEDNKRKKESEG